MSLGRPAVVVNSFEADDVVADPAHAVVNATAPRFAQTPPATLAS